MRAQTVKRNAQAALATALKIDAIESEMSSEFIKATTIQRQPPPAGPPPKTAPAAKTQPPAQPATQHAAPAQDDEPLPDLEAPASKIAMPVPDASAVFEEAAILHASGQSELAEQMLRAAIAEDTQGKVAMTAWLMLFDLYRIAGKQQEFDHLAVAFVNRCEISPPAWPDDALQANTQSAAPSGVAPMVSFAGTLDAGSAKYIERIRKLAQNYRSLRLEFTRISDFDAAGCGLLLEVLTTLQKSGHALILAGAAELAEKIHSRLAVGRRDDNENAWLLLLELLRLLNREQEFEEISIDYCITFEVSPPAFVAPQNKVTTATAAEAPAQAEGFAMPAVVEGRIDHLVSAIAAYADQHHPAVIDCTRLVRIDFNAASGLLGGLAPLCKAGKAFEFHHVNHLVAQLFAVIGLKDIARVFPRKT